MRKAKVAALVIGGVSACIFGGTFGVIATSPIVRSVTPNDDVQNIYEVQSEELANVAAVTSIRTTPRTTTSKNFYTVTTSTVTTSEMNGSSALKDLPTISVSFNGAMAKPNYKENKNEGTTEPSTQAATTAPATTVTVTSTVTTTTAAATTATTAATTTTTTASTTLATTVTTPVVTEIVTTTATETTTEAPTYTEPVTEEIVPPTESTETVTPVIPEDSEDSLPITDEEFIILCNAVAHEAGCNWISTYDKALVVEVIMNRVESNLFPNTILGVLTQPYQFTGSSNYVYLGGFSKHVTQDVKDAVTLYFTEKESFGHGYFYFYGDGYRNYFY